MKDITVMEIHTGGHGTLRVWRSPISGWCWATPNGSEGTLVPTIDQAVAEAFEAEGLTPDEPRHDYEAEREYPFTEDINDMNPMCGFWGKGEY